MQKNQRLIDEVNKLIKSILAGDGNVTLPTIGQLSVGEGESLLFTKEEGEVTIVDKIAQMGGCTKEQAEQIYNKWIEEVGTDGVIAIDEIGVIRGVEFTPYESVAKKEEEKEEKREEKREEEKEEAPREKYIPKSRRKSKEKKRVGGGWLWYIFFAIICVIAYIFISFLINQTDEAPIVVEYNVSQEECVVEQECVTEYVEECEIESCEQQKRYRVVCGVFNKQTNAERMVVKINQTTAKDEALQSAVELKMHPRHKGYMVVVFESEGFRSCVDFIKQYKGVVCDSMWIYDHKKM